MPTNEDLRDAKSLYAKLGVNKKWSGERSVFDNCDFRQISKDRLNRPIASIEVKMLNRDHGKVNLMYLPTYEDPTITQELIQAAVEELGPKFLFISPHLADNALQDICKHVQFELITDRNVLMRNKLPVDGVHLSFVRRFK